MARILTDSELGKIVAEGKIIEFGAPSSVEGLKYDFRLGSQILFAGAKEVNAGKLSETELSELHLDSGEMAFVLTEERLSLPKDFTVTLSQKRKMSHSGILVAGGSSVDPYYEGRIVLLLYNFSSTRFPLKPGSKIIAGIFSQLDEEEVEEPRKKPEPLEGFPDEVVALMREYSPFSPSKFDDEVSLLLRKFTQLEAIIKEGEGWRSDFQNGLKALEENIALLTRNLQEERNLRIEGDEEIRTRNIEIIDSLALIFESLEHPKGIFSWFKKSQKEQEK